MVNWVRAFKCSVWIAAYSLGFWIVGGIIIFLGSGGYWWSMMQSPYNPPSAGVGVVMTIAWFVGGAIMVLGSLAAYLKFSTELIADELARRMPPPPMETKMASPPSQPLQP